MKKTAVLILIVVSYSCDRPQSPVEKAATPVRVVTIETYKPVRGQPYSASILPNRQVNLAFRVNGFVESIYQVKGPDGRLRSVDIGDVVPQGTALARVREKDYQLQVSQAGGQAKQAQETEQAARAQLTQAEAAAVKAEQDFGRAEALFKKTSLTKSDYDAAKANYDATRAQVQAAQAQVQASGGAASTAQATLGTATLGLHDTVLAAPFTGSVVQRSVEIGTLTGPSAVAFVLADISSVKATFGVSDILVAHLKNGSPLSVYAEAFPSHQFRGIVSAIGAVADSSTRSFQVEVTIPNRSAMLKPGMIVSLDLGEPAQPAPVTAVPLDAVVRYATGSPQFAVVVVEGGLARRKPVTLGKTFGDHIAITGVAPGSEVVSSGATFLNDGDAVRVIP